MMQTEQSLNCIKKPEILAPAGSYESLTAAVNAGADAVYLGGDLFSARAFAGNFSKEELLDAIAFCHFTDVKVYMAVNTLFKEAEIGLLKDYIRPFYEAGVDAVLVQDPGAVKIMREEFSDLPLHASTQMSISSASGAAFLKELGFTRIVPARELTLKELEAIREQVDIEIETFVHGAMCFSYSGKCLFSSFLGGRSGNRGRCAQPCRQCYEIIQKGQTEKEYLMSLKDMCAIELLPELISAGIDSFKIEGRMKRPEYVALVTACYKNARDLYLDMTRETDALEGKRSKQETASLNEKGSKRETVGAFRSEKDRKRYLEMTGQMVKDLQDIYNRGGFCSGYYKEEKGRDMFAFDRPNHEGLLVGTVERTKGPAVLIRLCENVNPRDVLEIRDPEIELTCNVTGKAGTVIELKGKSLKSIRSGMKVYRTRNQELITHIDKEIIKIEKTIPVKAVVTAKAGQPLCVNIGGAAVFGSVVQKADRQPAEKERLLEKLKKTQGSNLVVEADFDMDDDIFISMSEFNSLRRQAAEKYREFKIAGFLRQ